MTDVNEEELVVSKSAYQMVAKKGLRDRETDAVSGVQQESKG